MNQIPFLGRTCCLITGSMVSRQPSTVSTFSVCLRCREPLCPKLGTFQGHHVQWLSEVQVERFRVGTLWRVTCSRSLAGVEAPSGLQCNLTSSMHHSSCLFLSYLLIHIRMWCPNSVSLFPEKQTGDTCWQLP